jgi:hypothetical protein
VSQSGVLEHLGPLGNLLDDNPLMPSGAALFVSAMVMLLDFTRPRWAPVTVQAKDWVLKCLDLCAPTLAAYIYFRSCAAYSKANIK